MGQGVTDDRTRRPKTQTPLGPVTCIGRQGLVGTWGTTEHMPHLVGNPTHCSSCRVQARSCLSGEAGDFGFLVKFPDRSMPSRPEKPGVQPGRRGGHSVLPISSLRSNPTSPLLVEDATLAQGHRPVRGQVGKPSWGPPASAPQTAPLLRLPHGPFRKWACLGCTLRSMNTSMKQ